MRCGKKLLVPLLSVSLSIALSGAVFGAEAIKCDVYPLGVCPVSGETLTSKGKPVSFVYKERHFRFCCKSCLASFTAEPEKYTKKVDAAIVKDQKPFYPLTTCLVSGQKLGSMGKPVDIVYGNRLIRFCCKGCVSAFKKNPTAYVTKLNKAVVKAQEKLYPLATCVVSGMKLGTMGEPVSFVHAHRLYRFCCKGCIARFKERPSQYAKKVPWKIYRCPMHPQVRTVIAGVCPVCKMKLLVVEKEESRKE